MAKAGGDTIFTPSGAEAVCEMAENDMPVGAQCNHQAFDERRGSVATSQCDGKVMNGGIACAMKYCIYVVSFA